MHELADFVYAHHVVTDPQRKTYGMVYEFWQDGKQNQEFGLDSMHDGAWFLSAMITAHRADPGGGWLERAQQFQVAVLYEPAAEQRPPLPQDATERTKTSSRGMHTAEGLGPRAVGTMGMASTAKPVSHFVDELFHRFESSRPGSRGCASRCLAVHA
jgi:hypothetical protein